MKWSAKVKGEYHGKYPDDLPKVLTNEHIGMLRHKYITTGKEFYSHLINLIRTYEKVKVK